MQDGYMVAMNSMRVSQQWINMLTKNLSNIYTPGYRSMQGNFRTFLNGSMVDDGILSGDYVVIKEQKNANNGDIVVAVLKNGFATLKRFYQEKNRIRLQPANSEMAPIYVNEVEIRGKVVAIIRQFN